MGHGLLSATGKAWRFE